MSVTVASASIISQRSVAASSFADDFNRANGDIGAAWTYQTVRMNANDAYFGAEIDTLQVRFVHSGSSLATGNAAVFLPRSLIGSPNIYGLQQFSELQFISAVTNFSEGGVCCFTRWDYSVQRCYSFLIFSGGAVQNQIISRNGIISTVIANEPTTVTNGSVYRLAVTPDTPVLGTNTIQLFKDGVQAISLTDNSLTALGCPGMFIGENFNQTMLWDNFRCGRGTG